MGYEFNINSYCERKISKKNRKICLFDGFFINLHIVTPDAWCIRLEIQDSPRRYKYPHNAGSGLAGTQFPGMAVLAPVDTSDCAFSAVGACVFLCVQFFPLSCKAL